MRQYRTPLLLLVAALLLGGAWCYVSSGRTVDDTGVLFALDTGETIDRVELSNGYGGFVFTPQGEAWAVEHQGVSYRASETKLELLRSALGYLEVSRVLEEARPEYGLDRPAATVTWHTSRGRSQSLTLGGETASRSDVYISDGQRVMVTSTGAVAQLTGPLEAYRAKDIFTVNVGDIRALTYYEDGARVVSVGSTGPRDWFLTWPYEAPARVIELNEFMAGVRKWTAAGYPQGDDYAAMGLEGEGGSRLELTDGDGNTQVLRFGAQEGTATYVRTGARHEVVKLYTADLDCSVLTPDALLFVAPLLTTVDRVARLEVRTSAGTAVLDVEQTGTAQRAELNGRPLSAEAFSAIFFKYIVMAADGRDGETPPGDLAAVLTTTFVDGSQTQLTLRLRDESTLFMELDGKTAYFLNTDRLTQLLYRVETALAASP